MKAFHNDPAVKAKYVDRLAAHRAAEHLTQGIGFETDRFDGTKGCAVGCTLDAYDHALYPVELGLPEWLARLEDRIFEGLPKGEAEQFAEDFLAAIPVGADVSKVRGKLAVQRHTRDLKRLEGNAEPYAEQVREAIRSVITWIEAGESARSAAERSAAESAAWSAAWSARSAERSAAESARSAAWSAAWSAERSAAESAAESAAWSARSAAAWSAAESAHYRWEAVTLLQLLREAPGA